MKDNSATFIMLTDCFFPPKRFCAPDPFNHILRAAFIFLQTRPISTLAVHTCTDIKTPPTEHIVLQTQIDEIVDVGDKTQLY